MSDCWYQVKIIGTHEGKPLELAGTIRARSPESAAFAVLRGEWPNMSDWWSPRVSNGRRGIYFWTDGDTEFPTDHETFDDMATEITDAAVLAKLDGAPMLPFDD